MSREQPFPENRGMGNPRYIISQQNRNVNILMKVFAQFFSENEDFFDANPTYIIKIILDGRRKTWYNVFTSCRGSFFVCERRGHDRLPRFYPGEGGTLSGRDIPGQNFQGGADRMRVKITLACSECKQRNYDTKKNKKNDPDRLELNKYCRFCRKHTLHRETK